MCVSLTYESHAKHSLLCFSNYRNSLIDWWPLCTALSLTLYVVSFPTNVKPQVKKNSKKTPSPKYLDVFLGLKFSPDLPSSFLKKNKIFSWLLSQRKKKLFFINPDLLVLNDTFYCMDLINSSTTFVNISIGIVVIINE